MKKNIKNIKFSSNDCLYNFIVYLFGLFVPNFNININSGFNFKFSDFRNTIR